jgi:hypothetical protein
MAGSFQGCCGDFRIVDGWVRAFGPDGSHRWRSPLEAPGGLGVFSDRADTVTAGAAGAIYVGGWVATRAENDEVAAPHELFLQRLDHHGGVVWSRVYPATAHVDQQFGVDLAVRRDALVASALVDGRTVVFKGSRPGHAWLGRFTLDGDPVWCREWGTTWNAAAQPVGVSTDRGGRIFVTGTARDPSDGGLDAFVRSYSAAGDLRWTLRLQAGHRLMVGGDVAWGHGGLSALGEALTKRDFGWSRGYLWRFPSP